MRAREIIKEVLQLSVWKIMSLAVLVWGHACFMRRNTVLITSLCQRNGSLCHKERDFKPLEFVSGQLLEPLNCLASLFCLFLWYTMSRCISPFHYVKMHIQYMWQHFKMCSMYILYVRMKGVIKRDAHMTYDIENIFSFLCPFSWES